MPKLPPISGDKAVKCFKKLGYVIVRQEGSHIRLRQAADPTRPPLTVPRHPTLGKGLLRKLMRDAEVNLEQLIDLL